MVEILQKFCLSTGNKFVDIHRLQIDKWITEQVNLI